MGRLTFSSGPSKKKKKKKALFCSFFFILFLLCSSKESIIGYLLLGVQLSSPIRNLVDFIFFSTSIFPAQDGKLLNISVQKSVRAFSFYLRKTIKFQEMHLLWECLISPSVFWKQKLQEKTSLNFCSMKCFP